MMPESLAIPGLLLIRSKVFSDARGYFVETFSEAASAKAGLPRFVQDNESMSRRAGTVRGLHFQTDPHAQAKLVRCVDGSVFEVAVDIRRGSPTFGKHMTLTLTGGDGLLLFVPVGFAHGFCALEANTIVQYKVSAPYSPAHELGIAWDDPALDIRWPTTAGEAILSDRDRRHPRLAELSDNP